MYRTESNNESHKSQMSQNNVDKECAHACVRSMSNNDPLEIVSVEIEKVEIVEVKVVEIFDNKIFDV